MKFLVTVVAILICVSSVHLKGMVLVDAQKVNSCDVTALHKFCSDKESDGCCAVKPDYMNTTCTQQCQGGCKDRISNCQVLKKLNWCTKAVSWMQINCCETCAFESCGFIRDGSCKSHFKQIKRRMAWSECREKCKKNDGCVMFSATNDNTRRWCELYKRGACSGPGAKNNKRRKLYSLKECKAPCGFIRDGACTQSGKQRIRVAAVSGFTESQCREACKNETGCGVFFLGKPGGGLPGFCSLYKEGSEHVCTSTSNSEKHAAMYALAACAGAVNYGEKVYIKSNAAYLRANKGDAETAILNPGLSGVWTIEKADSTSSGCVQYGDKMHLRNSQKSNPENQYLDTNGYGPDGFAVQMAASKTRDGRSGTWILDGGSGCVQEGAGLYVRQTSNWGTTFLHNTQTDVVTAWHNYDAGRWQIVAKDEPEKKIADTILSELRDTEKAVNDILSIA